MSSPNNDKFEDIRRRLRTKLATPETTAPVATQPAPKDKFDDIRARLRAKLGQPGVTETPTPISTAGLPQLPGFQPAEPLSTGVAPESALQPLAPSGMGMPLTTEGAPELREYTPTGRPPTEEESLRADIARQRKLLSEKGHVPETVAGAIVTGFLEGTTGIDMDATFGRGLPEEAYHKNVYPGVYRTGETIGTILLLGTAAGAGKGLKILQQPYVKRVLLSALRGAAQFGAVGGGKEVARQVVGQRPVSPKQVGIEAGKLGAFGAAIGGGGVAVAPLFKTIQTVTKGKGLSYTFTKETIDQIQKNLAPEEARQIAGLMPGYTKMARQLMTKGGKAHVTIPPEKIVRVVNKPWFQNFLKTLKMDKLGKAKEYPLPKGAPKVGAPPIETTGYAPVPAKVVKGVKPPTIAPVAKAVTPKPSPKPPVSAVAEKAPKVKESWEMTREEYVKHWQEKTGVKAVVTLTPAHRHAIEKAVSEGKPVPAKVLRDYPELVIAKPGPSPAQVEAKTVPEQIDKLHREIQEIDHRIATEISRAKFEKRAPETATIMEELTTKEKSLEQLRGSQRMMGGPPAPTPDYIRHLEWSKTHDALTGKWNKEAWDGLAAGTFKKGGKFSVLFGDIDHFKHMQDVKSKQLGSTEQGHFWGNKAIKDYFDITERIVKKHGGFVGRHSGDELMAGLPGKTVKEAIAIGQEIRGAIAARGLAGLDASVSIGVATRTEGTKAVVDILKHADRALYEAKEAGKNRVFTYKEAETQVEIGSKAISIHGRVEELVEELSGIPTAPKAERPPTVPPKKAGEGVAEPAPTGKPERVESINLDRLATTPEGRETIKKSIKVLKPELQKAKGEKLTHAEVLEEAEKANILKGTSTRAQQLKAEAELLNARRLTAHLADKLDVAGGKASPELWRKWIDSLMTTSTYATEKGRALEAMKVMAIGQDERERLVVKVLKRGADFDAVIEAAKGVDFTNAKEAAEFYRKFVPANLAEWVDYFRYINMLSNPKTQVLNALGNLFQAPIAVTEKLAAGGIDRIANVLTGRARDHYVREVGPFVKGYLNAQGDAVVAFADAMKGKSLIYRPDVPMMMPVATKGAAYQAGTVIRFMEGMDRYFYTQFEVGEAEALAYKYGRMGKTVEATKIEKKAQLVAARRVFREPLNAEGQGYILNVIDNLTKAVYKFRELPLVKWFIPFVKTNASILKQGVELSPLGFTTIPGSADPITQLARTMVGTVVFSGAAWFAMNDRLTAGVPKSKEERALFYATGRKPWSIKLGDKWVGYPKLGPLAFPVAMVAVIKEKMTDRGMSDNDIEKATKMVGDMSKFFSDQSSLQGMANLISVMEGEERAIERMLTNMPRQMIPFVSMQGTISRIVDDTFRQAKTVPERFKVGIPFLSKQIKAHTKPYYVIVEGRLHRVKELDTPSKRQYRFLNAFSPFTISREDPVYEKIYKKWTYDTARDRLTRAIRDGGKLLITIDALKEEIERGNYSEAEKKKRLAVQDAEAEKVVNIINDSMNRRIKMEREWGMKTGGTE